MYGSGKAHGSSRTGWRSRKALLAGSVTLVPPLTSRHLPYTRSPLLGRPSFSHPFRLLLVLVLVAVAVVFVVVVRTRAPRSGKPIKTRQVHSPGSLQWLLRICSLLHPLRSYFLVPPPVFSISCPSVSFSLSPPPAPSSCLSFSPLFPSYRARFSHLVFPSPLFPSLRPFSPCRSSLYSALFPFLAILSSYCRSIHPRNLAGTVICSHIVSTILSRRMGTSKKDVCPMPLCECRLRFRIPVVARFANTFCTFLSRICASRSSASDKNIRQLVRAEQLKAT